MAKKARVDKFKQLSENATTIMEHHKVVENGPKDVKLANLKEPLKWKLCHRRREQSFQAETLTSLICGTNCHGQLLKSSGMRAMIWRCHSTSWQRSALRTQQLDWNIPSQWHNLLLVCKVVQFLKRPWKHWKRLQKCTSKGSQDIFQLQTLKCKFLPFLWMICCNFQQKLCWHWRVDAVFCHVSINSKVLVRVFCSFFLWWIVECKSTIKFRCTSHNTPVQIGGRFQGSRNNFVLSRQRLTIGSRYSKQRGQGTGLVGPFFLLGALASRRSKQMGSMKNAKGSASNGTTTNGGGRTLSNNTEPKACSLMLLHWLRLRQSKSPLPFQP